MLALPIDPLLPHILASLHSHPNLIIQAAPGAGKTTRVPTALLALNPGEILVLEPRRLAARMAARRVASELGEPLGATIGYQVRFEEVASPATRIRFATEGILTRRLLTDSRLTRATTVILDEFHERHIDTDLAIALLRRLQLSTRPDLHIVVMSATLHAAPVSRFLGDAPVLTSEGRLFPINITYLPPREPELEQQVAAALESLIHAGLNGDVLVFLPGAAEIRRCLRACEAIGRRTNLLLVPLHGDLSPAEQDRAVLPAPQRKVIFSTNVAESSITIEGVAAVIDSGLARIAADSPWSGLPSVEVTRISKASAQQRAGRAGRTAPGSAIRLYSEDDFVRRRDHDEPEISRRELSHVLLDLKVMHAEDLEWLTPPPTAALMTAAELLDRLTSGDSRILQALARLPLHPRLARLVVEAAARSAGELGCALAAILSAGDRLTQPPAHPAPSDLLLLAEQPWPHQTKRVYDQVRRAAGSPSGHDEIGALIATLAAFPDRVARRRQGREYNLAAGGSALLSDHSAVNADFIVAVDIEIRRDRGLPMIRLASAVEPEWLIELFPGRIEDRDEVEWNRTAERAEHISALFYEGFTLMETRGGVADAEAASALLAAKAWEAGIGRFLDPSAFDLLQARAAFAGQPLSDSALRTALAQASVGLRSFADLERVDLLAILQSKIPRLDQLAPARIRLPGGRETHVNYAAGQPPWIASRLQDFFGMTETPRINGTPLVVHLLAPNQRPVQMTSDLAGFWSRLYPQVRKELSRRYPRHKWPENPL